MISEIRLEKKPVKKSLLGDRSELHLIDFLIAGNAHFDCLTDLVVGE